MASQTGYRSLISPFYFDGFFCQGVIDPDLSGVQQVQAPRNQKRMFVFQISCFLFRTSCVSIVNRSLSGFAEETDRLKERREVELMRST